MNAMPLREALRRQWLNGGRRLIMMSIIALIAITVANAVLLGVLLRPMRGPLHFTNPQQVLTPVVAAEGVLVAIGTKCNDLDVEVAVAATHVFHRVGDGEPRSVFLANSGGVRPPGCTTQEYRTQLPPTLPPGTWRLVGVNVVVATTGERQTLSWYTEPFNVVP